MDASENNQKNSNNTLNDWFSNPFERVNHSTNFEDYACAPDDNNYLNTNSTSYVKKATIPSINKEMGSTSLKLTNKANVWNYLSDPRDHSSSAEVTPSGSPQNSPYSIRKSMEGKKVSKNGTNELSLNNSKRWFYSGFFNTDLKAGLEDKPMTKTSSFKNLCVSNFDINAVGPTSW
ncbi:uncharacterized protein LOC128964518 [Oppia nitens]|uniref:uncharacterized protein LOC128964518 n=1 Tax=Oppia nitens TaxID=1686743 RepID=UPI0023DBAC72|nr:uncharacterized protein LOC128964518 [Oppia nitens]